MFILSPINNTVKLCFLLICVLVVIRIRVLRKTIVLIFLTLNIFSSWKVDKTSVICTLLLLWSSLLKCTKLVLIVWRRALESSELIRVVNLITRLESTKGIALLLSKKFRLFINWLLHLLHLHKELLIFRLVNLCRESTLILNLLLLHHLLHLKHRWLSWLLILVWLSNESKCRHIWLESCCLRYLYLNLRLFI